MSKESLDCLLRDNQTDWPWWLAYSTRDPKKEIQPLFDVEEEAVRYALEKRRAEFSAGRDAAHAALTLTGCRPISVPMGKDHAPIWPKGKVGSITHTDNVCLAVAASSHHAQSIGVDVENLTPIANSYISKVAKPEEIDFVGGAPSLAALRIFSMKEAGFKAQYYLSKRNLEFDELKVTTGGLLFRHVVPPFPQNFLLPIRQWANYGLCLSLCVISPQGQNKCRTPW